MFSAAEATNTILPSSAFDWDTQLKMMSRRTEITYLSIVFLIHFSIPAVHVDTTMVNDSLMMINCQFIAVLFLLLDNRISIYIIELRKYLPNPTNWLEGMCAPLFIPLWWSMSTQDTTRLFWQYQRSAIIKAVFLTRQTLVANVKYSWVVKWKRVILTEIF